jgi:hypothetical protein
MTRRTVIIGIVVMMLFSVTVYAQTHTLRVFWNPVQDVDPLTYRVYMSIDGAGFQLYKTSEVDVCEIITDPLDTGYKYCFAVSAVDPAGNESAMSTERPCKDYAGPGTPTGVGCEEIQRQ